MFFLPGKERLKREKTKLEIFKKLHTNPRLTLQHEAGWAVPLQHETPLIPTVQSEWPPAPSLWSRLRAGLLSYLPRQMGVFVLFKPREDQ